MDTTNAAQSTEPQAPRGFCPHCDYPIDPGLCPECGKTVAPEKLRSRSRRQRVRRLAKVVLRLVLVGVLLAGGYRFYQSKLWAPYVPLSIVLNESQNVDWARAELERRIFGSNVDQETLNAVADALAEFKLSLMSPRPNDIPLKFVLQPTSIPLRYNLVTGRCTARIDGTAINQKLIEPDIKWSYSPTVRFGMGADEIDTELAPGKHKLDVALDITLFMNSSRATGVYHAPIQRTVSIQSEFEVSDKRLNEFVTCKPATSDELQKIRESIKLSVCTGLAGEQPYLYVLTRNPPLPLRGVLNICIPGDPIPFHTLEFGIPNPHSNTIQSRSLGGPDFALNPNLKAIDLRFTPDLLRIFEYDATPPAGIEIIWRDIPLNVLHSNTGYVSNFNINNWSDDWIRAPTEVKHWPTPKN